MHVHFRLLQSYTNYRKLLLVQGQMKTPCKCSVTMMPTARNIEILEPYIRMVKSIYVEAEVPVILGSILSEYVVLT